MREGSMMIMSEKAGRRCRRAGEALKGHFFSWFVLLLLLFLASVYGGYRHDLRLLRHRHLHHRLGTTFMSCLRLNALPATTGVADEPSSTLREKNERFLAKLEIIEPTISRLCDDQRLRLTDFSVRAKELRESVGLSRTTLKQYLQKYPDLCIGMFADPVKSSKSVVMRMLNVSEAQYVQSVARIQRQTNFKAGSLFRGSFSFIVASLRSTADCGDADLSFIFENYPTIFTLNHHTVASHLRFLRKTLGYSGEQVRLLLRKNARAILCSQEIYLSLRAFFSSELDLSNEQFCSITVAQPRLLSVSLANTISPKVAHLKDASTWALTKERLRTLTLNSPSIFTTPAETTEALWKLLSIDLGMCKQACQELANRFPNILRINAKALDEKLCLFALAQLDVMIQAGMGERQLDAGSVGGVAEARSLLSDVAAACLTKGPVSMTCSIDRIKLRLVKLGAHVAVETYEESNGVSISAHGGELLLMLLRNQAQDPSCLASLEKRWQETKNRLLIPPSAISDGEAKFERFLTKRLNGAGEKDGHLLHSASLAST